MAYIYKITNDVNEKIYIGKTLVSIEERWRCHKKDSKTKHCEKRPLYNAINKYGIEHFHIEQIEECSSDIVNEREKYWIEYYGSFKYGYNATKGGDGKQYADYDLIFALWNEGKTNKEIQTILGYDSHTIRTALSNKGISVFERRSQGHREAKKMVAMLDKETNEIIKVFPSIMEAERYFNTSKTHISTVCKGKRKTALGYGWKYIN